MALTLYDSTDIQAIANAIRSKNLKSDTYKVSEMAAAINAIRTELEVLPQDEVSGAIANFPDGSNGYPVVEAIFGIEPIQTGTGDPSPTNVRPILAANGLTIYHSKKNLLDPNTLALRQVTSGGVERLAYSPIILDVGQYTLSFEGNDPLYITNISNNYSFDTVTTSPYTLTVNSKALYMIRTAVNTVSQYTNTNVQFEKGNTATNYEAYQGETITVMYPDPPQIIFKGTLNLTTGEITVTHRGILIGDSSLTWHYNSSVQVFYAYFNDKKYGRLNIKSDIYVAEDTTYDQLSNYKLCGTGNTYSINIKDTRYNTVESFIEGVGNNILLYELETPITYQLDPEEMQVINTYYGVNNFWCKSADYGDLDITYRADVALYIDKISS